MRIKLEVGRSDVDTSGRYMLGMPCMDNRILTLSVEEQVKIVLKMSVE